MTALLSAAIVTTFGAALIGFAMLVTLRRPIAERFLRLLGASAPAHYAEQLSRVVVGAALIGFSPAMRYARVFEVFGWLMVLTSVVLLLMPWRWHQRFAERVMPLVVRYLRVYAAGALALGLFILFAATRSTAR
ncbi:MAG: hypothetical protein AB7L66_16425 [Gemmatimonadales bacterium]